MKIFERIILFISVISLIAAIALIVIQWKKDSDIWQSIKKAIETKEILKIS